MTTNINDDDDDAILANDNPSICIPRVFNSITVSFISNLFQNEIKLGRIQKIDIIKNYNDTQFKKVFIHFEEWYNTDKNNIIKQKLYDGKIIKIVYDYPWFWKCALNKSS